MFERDFTWGRGIVDYNWEIAEDITKNKIYIWFWERFLFTAEIFFKIQAIPACLSFKQTIYGRI